MAMAAADPSSSERPTTVRYGVLAFSITMSLLLYLDRFALSVSQTTIMAELELDEIAIGRVSGVFFYVYALAQVPSGWFSDRYGGRLTLTLYVLGWSLAVGGMGFSMGLTSLLVTRSLLGLAQAGAYPCIAGVIKNWFPLRQRGLANSLTTMGGRLGNLICLAITPSLMTVVGALVGWKTGQWRVVFGIYAALGVVWSLGFWRFFRNQPQEHPRCNASEVHDILPVGGGPAKSTRTQLPPFLAMSRCPTIYLLSLISFFVNVGWVFLATWLPTYLEKVHEVDKVTAGWLAVIPGAASMLGGVLGGLSTDRLVRRIGLTWGRRTTGVIATAGAALAYFIGLQSDMLAVEITTFAIAGFMIDFGLGSLWAVYQDISGPHVSSVLGFGNMCGNLAAGRFTVVIGGYAKAGDWNTVFMFSVGALLLTMTCWLFVNPARQLASYLEEPFLAKHPRLKLLLKLFAVAMVTLLLIEGGLRLAGVQTLSDRRSPPQNPADLHSERFIAEAQRMGWIPWPKTRKRIAPVAEHPRGYIEMIRNGESCREDGPTPLTKPAGTIRVLSLGDSHTDGTGFNDESMVSCLEREAPPDAEGRKIDGVNAGFGPSSPYQQLWAYEKVYRRFHADEVVVVYYAGNDLLELLREDDRVHLERRDGKFVHAEPTAAPDVTRTTNLRWERSRQWLRDHSAMYAALTDIPALRRAVRKTVSDAYRERLEQAMEQHPAPVWQGLNQAYLFKHQPERRPEAVDRLRFVLERFQQLTKEDGARLTLVVLPTLRMIQPNVDTEGLADSMKMLELTDEEAREDERSCDVACELADELRIRRLDLRPAFRDVVAGDPQVHLFFQFDHHLTPRGQSEIARRLLEFWRNDASR